MRALLMSLAITLAAACAAGSGAPGGAPRPSLDGEWREATRALHPPTITFEGDRASGFAGCNRWFATVTRGDYPALSFRGVGVTRMMCESAQMTIERDFLSALRDTQIARLDGDQLVLADIAGAERARFARIP